MPQGMASIEQRGSRYLLGIGTDDQFVVWDQTTGSRTFVQPRNDEGWKRAWKAYASAEGQGAASGGGGVFKWVILVVNVLFLIWVIAGASTGSGRSEAEQAGTAIGVGIIIVFWAMVDVILGVIYLVTRPRRG